MKRADTRLPHELPPCLVNESADGTLHGPYTSIQAAHKWVALRYPNLATRPVFKTRTVFP